MGPNTGFQIETYLVTSMSENENNYSNHLNTEHLNTGLISVPFSNGSTYKWQFAT